ncbi:MAG TPA: MHYT domain-containing protein [Bosea sp. (in: a-proteobacteria)]|uniref:MHYT domain-containing protein n=1 Tax=Bosea sp. (in: a-proteobacteria) TaxID=1871050 RepID=UPI002DDCC39A|nr:MHYT domain-containing protein [Bosea sp. (in: a-proteobacteria)]HEV2554458.1 MHYT domain-containing protein [Bosea sp. (in: a-proteobacteria)]
MINACFDRLPVYANREYFVTLTGSHNSFLVALSLLIAVLASYAALDLAGRIRATTGWASRAWLLTAAVALGGGIWAMHFIAMLSFSMPGIPVQYDVWLTIFSFVLPILVTGLGFLIVKRPGSGRGALLASGLVMGLGIAAMHYTGMAAMKMEASLSYRWDWATLSVLIAVAAATTALALAFSNTGPAQRAAASIIMGVAIAGMHYTAMAAAQFSSHEPAMTHGDHRGIGQGSLATAIAALTFVILALSLIAASFDRRFAALAEKEADALRRSEEQFRRLYRGTPVPLHALDSEGRLEQVSDAWLELLGHRRERAIGSPITQFMTEASASRRLEIEWGTLLQTGELRNAHHRFVTRAGRILDVIVAERVERDEQGNFARVVGGLLDITEQKRAEEALRQAQKIEAVGQLTGGVAHDFNNLLAVIMGNLDLLKKRVPPDPKLERLVQNALQGVQRGAALTQRMLSFARRQDLRAETVDVPALVRGMEDLLQRSIGPQISVVTQFPLTAVQAHVDANQLEMALLNLVVNARDAMPEGGRIIIAVDVVVGQQTAQSADFVRLSVRDEGEGMDEATLAKAREPFFTTKGVGKGTGLGLSMVHGFAEQSGGRLVLASEQGNGTTAEIWLPAARAEQKIVEPPEPAQPAAPMTPALRILVVDDDSLVRMNAVAMLEDLGHQVDEASSGLEALSLLNERRFDLMITDQAMPKMTGMQLAESVRAILPTLPILVATGYAELPSGSSLPRLSKPFDQAELARAIEACLKSTQHNIVPFPAQSI